MKKRRKKIKYFKPRMRFNPGIAGFEPDLPVKPRKMEKKKPKISWFYIILILIILLVTLIAFYYFV